MPWFPKAKRDETGQANTKNTWVSGALLSFLALSFGVSGYSLPWDEIGFWALQVVSAVPETTDELSVPFEEVSQLVKRHSTEPLQHIHWLSQLELPLSPCCIFCWSESKVSPDLFGGVGDAVNASLCFHAKWGTWCFWLSWLAGHSFKPRHSSKRQQKVVDTITTVNQHDQVISFMCFLWW